MNGWFGPILIYLAGLVLLFAEVFIPGGVLGLAGGVLALIGVYFIFSKSAVIGGALFATTLIFGFFLFRWAIERMMHRDTGKASEGYVATEEGLENLVGARGKAVSHLRPSGIVKIDHRRVDVVTQGPRIDAGTEVEVLKVEGNRVIVREVRD